MKKMITKEFINKILNGAATLVDGAWILNGTGDLINIMIAFALIIVTPLSTVAIAYTISLAGLGSGAANVGITVALFTLAYGSSRVNKGTTFALFFAGSKILMPNYLGNPIMSLPIVINSIVTDLSAYIFKIQKTTASAGFGLTGLAGPINVYTFMEANVFVSVMILIVQYLLVPLGIAMITHTIFTKMNLYTDDMYKFAGSDK